MVPPVAGFLRLLVVALAAFFLSSCGSSDEGAVPEIIIISPHGSDIRLEFDRAFTAWHKAKYGTAVKLRWPDIGGGGTGTIIHYLDPLYQSGNTSGYDIIWGGGSANFENFRKRGYFERPELAQAVLDRVPKDIFGTPLHGKDDLWIAATMSNFGIVINKERLGELGIPVPRVWADLADAKWFNNLSLTDPSKSNSVLSSYDCILAQYGWEQGWGLLMKMFANAPVIRASGADPADDVGSASAAAGIVIDFYGRKHIIRVGPKIVGFVIPEGGSTIDSDPIAVLKGAPHKELAAHFIEFVISPEGQRLWTFRSGTPGGPARYMLGRMSVLPELYEKESRYMTEPTSPFAIAEPLKIDLVEQRNRAVFLGDLLKSALVDNHDLLVETREALIQAGDPGDLLARLEALPTFVPTTVDARGELVEGKERAIGEGDLAAVAEEFKPSGAVKGKYTERLQTGLKSLWQSEFRMRLEVILREARGRRKGG